MERFLRKKTIKISIIAKQNFQRKTDLVNMNLTFCYHLICTHPNNFLLFMMQNGTARNLHLHKSMC
jgi:hypothetical protein